MTMVFVRKFKVNARIVRIFNTYGPKMDKRDGRVIVNFINQALGEKPLTVYGKGTQTRSFCYIDDTIKGIMKAMFEKKLQERFLILGIIKNAQYYNWPK